MRRLMPAVLILVLMVAPAAAQDATEGVVFRQVAKLTATDAADGADFGYSVAIDGDRLIVGSIFADGGLGSAYIFERMPSGGWAQVAKLVAPDGVPGDWFGGNVSLSGDTTLVAASVNDQSRHGYAYVFDRDAGGPGAWGPVAKLLAAGGEPDDSFAASQVALGGDTAVVGASFADGPGAGDDGAVYIFERDAGGADAWEQVAKLTAAKACRLRSPVETYCGWPDGRFGAAIAVSGDTLAVGNGEIDGGYAYVFRRVGEGPASRWRRVARLAASDEDQNGFATVAVSGETVVVGASGDDDLSNASGAAYLFEPDPQGPMPWREVVKLHPQDGAAGDYFNLYFGSAVAVDADTVVVGAPEIGGGGGMARGKAYVFRRDAGGPGAWGAVARLRPAELEFYDNFGSTVAVSGETVVVGAYGDDDRGDEAGAVYVYEAARVEAAEGIWGGPPQEISRDPAGRTVLGEQDRPFAAAASGRAEVRWDAPDPDLDGLPRLPGQSNENGWDTWLVAGARGVGTVPRPGSIAWAPDERPGQASVGASTGERAGQQALLCFDFSRVFFGDFCDGLELTLSGGTLTGLWRNTDCEGTNVPVAGTLEGGRARVVCDAAKDPCPAGFTSSWIIDGPLDGTMDMLQLDGVWNSWIDELPYTATTGPCPFRPQGAPRPVAR